MKKSVIITFVFTLILSVMLLGCISKTKQGSEYISPKGISKTIPKTINVSPKDTFILNLEANITTGFTWEVDIKDSKIIKLTDRNYQTDSSDKDYVGSGAVETFSFEALNKGTTKLKLKYAQQWEGGLDGETINITVIVE